MAMTSGQLVVPRVTGLMYADWIARSLSGLESSGWLVDSTGSPHVLPADLDAFIVSVNPLILGLIMAGYEVQTIAMLVENFAPGTILWIDTGDLRVWEEELFNEEQFNQIFGGDWPVLTGGKSAKVAVAFKVQRRGMYPGQCTDHGASNAVPLPSAPAPHVLAGSGGHLFSELEDGWLFLGASSENSLQGWATETGSVIHDWLTALVTDLVAIWEGAAGTVSVNSGTLEPEPGLGLRHIYDSANWVVGRGDLAPLQEHLSPIWEMIKAGDNLQDFVEIELGLSQDIGLPQFQSVLELATVDAWDKAEKANAVVGMVLPSGELDDDTDEALPGMLSYTELLACLHTLALVDVLPSTAPVPAAPEVTDPDLTGFYENGDTSGSIPLSEAHTLQVNHVGSYLRGYLQLRSGTDSDRNLTAFSFESMDDIVSGETSGSLVATVQFEGAYVHDVPGELRSNADASEVELVITEGKLSDDFAGPLQLKRVSQDAHLSDTAIAESGEGLQARLSASQRAPLHSLEVKEVLRIAEAAVEVLQSETLDMAVIGELSGPDFLEALDAFPDNQRPLVSYAVAMMLEMQMVGANTAWHRLMEVLVAVGDQSSSIREALEAYPGEHSYSWDLVLGGDLSFVVGLAGVMEKLGKVLNKVMKLIEMADLVLPGIAWTVYPAGSLRLVKDESEVFQYYVMVVGGGIQAGLAYVPAIQSTGNFPSERDLDAQDFVGSLQIIGVNAAFSYLVDEFNKERGVMVFGMSGAGALWTPVEFTSIGALQFAAGVNYLVGWLVLMSDPSTPGDVLAGRVPTVTDDASKTAVGFELDEFELMRDARNTIRAFAAEHLALFQSPFTKLEIHGFASQSGTAEYNQQLSEKRARAVLQAFRDAVPTDRFLIPDSEILICGYGEEQAQAVEDPLDRRVDVMLNGRLVLRLTQKE